MWTASEFDRTAGTTAPRARHGSRRGYEPPSTRNGLASRPSDDPPGLRGVVDRATARVVQSVRFGGPGRREHLLVRGRQQVMPPLRGDPAEQAQPRLLAPTVGLAAALPPNPAPFEKRR